MKLRISFLSMAYFLFIIATFLSSAPVITDENERQRTGTEYLDIKIIDDGFTNKSPMPGDTIDFSPKVAISSQDEAYIFIGMKIPSEFTLEGFHSELWHPIEEGSNIYYYGTENQYVALGGKNSSPVPILTAITLSTECKGGESFSPSITAYAIQANDINASTSPALIYSMVGSQEESDDI